MVVLLWSSIIIVAIGALIGAFLGSLFTLLLVSAAVSIALYFRRAILHKIVDELLDQVFDATMEQIIEKLDDSGGLDRLIEALVDTFQKSFASAKGVAGREAKGFDRRLVRALLKQSSPVVQAFLNSTGLDKYAEDHPGVVFHVMQNYPQLFAGAQQNDQAGQNPPSNQV